MRTFVYSDASSHKFWNIDVQGNAFTVQFGRVGTKGQTQVKQFTDEAAARREADKLIREKVRKGYAETTAPTGPAALRRSMEEAINENPADRAAHAALADLLQEQGDPQGEFIQVQLALEDTSLPPARRRELAKREKELLAAHGKEWAGEWAELAVGGGPTGRCQHDFPGPKPYRFVRGLLAEVTIDELAFDCARELVAAPRTRMVRALRVGELAYDDETHDPEEEEVPDHLVDVPSVFLFPRWPYFGNLRVFQLGWTSDESYLGRSTFQCHLRCPWAHEVVKRMPRLEELYLFADSVDVGAIFRLKTLTNLRVLQIYHNWDYPLEALADNPAVSNLTHLLLHPKALGHWSDEDVYIKTAGAHALLRSRNLGNLTHLRLRLTKLGDADCAEFVRSGIFKRLKTLDLRHSCVTDVGARTLAACPDVKNLELLDLSANRLTASGIAALRRAGVRLAADHQQTARDQDDDLYLHQGDYE